MNAQQQLADQLRTVAPGDLLSIPSPFALEGSEVELQIIAVRGNPQTPMIEAKASYQGVWLFDTMIKVNEAKVIVHVQEEN